jgi:hypothetical protein
MPLRRFIDGLFLGASLGTVHLPDRLSGLEAVHLVPWLLVVPFLDSVIMVYQRRMGIARHEGAATTDLRSLMLACGYSPAKSRWIRTAFVFQCALAGLALWYARAPGWVSIAGLTLLVGLYLFWFCRRRQALDQSVAPSWSRTRTK